MDEQQGALLGQLLDRLQQLRYRFVVPTPETHRRVLERRTAASDVRDVLGWSKPFERDVLEPELFALLEGAGMLERDGNRFRSMIRAASLGDALFLHSAYPTDGSDSVFFGPDSYRFIGFLERELEGRQPPARILDIGAGSGVGGIWAAMRFPNAHVTLVDINPLALQFARINARHNGVEVDIVEGSGVDAVPGQFELVVSNPPFMVDCNSRAYRDGGDMLGAALSLDWALSASARLVPGGAVLLYTGSAIVGGEDQLESTLRERLPGDVFNLRYYEIDPDIFGEQLSEPGYEQVERIAAVGAVLERLSS